VVNRPPMTGRPGVAAASWFVGLRLWGSSAVHEGRVWQGRPIAKIGGPLKGPADIMSA
jgi:hypothetical protein